MRGWRRTTPCERAAQWISFDLDGELSEIERAGLHRHLGRCDECRRLSGELAGLTALVRATPVVDPVGRLVFVPPRRRARMASRVGFAVATAGVVAALAALATTRGGSDLTGGSGRPLAFADVQQQIRFAHDKYLQMEPQRAAVLQEALAASIPSLSRRALR